MDTPSDKHAAELSEKIHKYINHLACSEHTHPCEECKAFDDFISLECSGNDKCSKLWLSFINKLIAVEAELVLTKRNLLLTQQRLDKVDKMLFEVTVALENADIVPRIKLGMIHKNLSAGGSNENSDRPVS